MNYIPVNWLTGKARPPGPIPQKCECSTNNRKNQQEMHQNINCTKEFKVVDPASEFFSL